MNCREFTEFLDDYFDGTLTDAERAVFDEHLAECPFCRDYLATYRQTVAVVREAYAVPAAAPPASAPEELIQAILAARPCQN
jgi:anti-sigma factor RsiW